MSTHAHTHKLSYGITTDLYGKHLAYVKQIPGISAYGKSKTSVKKELMGLCSKYLNSSPYAHSSLERKSYSIPNERVGHFTVRCR